MTGSGAETIEDQTNGEAITEFVVAAVLPGGIKNILKGQSVGNKFIRPVNPVSTTNLMLIISSTLSSSDSTIAQFAVYNC